MKRMTFKEIQEEIFYPSGDSYWYDDYEAEVLYDYGVDYKRLAIAKWLFVKECLKQAIHVHGVGFDCGYCFEYPGCVYCPLYSDDTCCNGVIHEFSVNRKMEDLNYILRCVRTGKLK